MSKWHKLWTKEEDQYMREHYPDNPTADVAKVLGRTQKAVIGRAKAEVDFVRYTGESVDTGFNKAEKSDQEKLPNGVVRVVRHSLE